MECKNTNCPAYAKCTADYRGSRCAANRATYGLGDPFTNADRIRAMTDEELAKWIARQTTAAGQIVPDEEYKFWLDWLKQEVEDA